MLAKLATLQTSELARQGSYLAQLASHLAAQLAYLHTYLPPPPLPPLHPWGIACGTPFWVNDLKAKRRSTNGRLDLVKLGKFTNKGYKEGLKHIMQETM